MKLRELTEQEKKYKEHILGIRKLNIPKGDFIKTNNYAIQQLYCDYYFKNIKQSELIASGIKEYKLNSLITKIKQSGNFNDIFDYTPSGIGPGEVMLYFLISNSELGGQRKRGDLKVGNVTYEIKVPEISSGNKFARDVRIAGGGGTESMQSVLGMLLALRKRLNLDNLEASKIDMMRTKAHSEFLEIEKIFAEGVEDYFKGKKVIILNGNETNRGMVVKIFDRVTRDKVTLYRYTGNEFKANISLL